MVSLDEFLVNLAPLILKIRLKWARCDLSKRVVPFCMIADIGALPAAMTRSLGKAMWCETIRTKPSYIPRIRFFSQSAILKAIQECGCVYHPLRHAVHQWPMTIRKSQTQ